MIGGLMNDQYLNALKKTKRVTGHKTLTIKEEMSIMNTLNEETPDVYGTGAVIDGFQKRMSEVLGKEASVFFPSGTMAQQIALRIWSDETENKKVAYHPLSHLEIHEQDGLKELHHIQSVLLGTKERLFTIEDLKALEDVSVVLFELPQREIGGQLPTWEKLVEMVNYCHQRGFKTHLDGARLFECLPYYNKPIQEITSLFDSVYISFYKGLGGITGAMLSGPKLFTETSKIWKRRHGGDLYHLYPYIVTSENAYNLRSDKMATYYNNAVIYANLLREIKGVTILPELPVCNMFHIFFDDKSDKLKKDLVEIMQETGLALFGGIREVEGQCKIEVSIGDQFETIGLEMISEAVRLLKDIRAK